LFRVVDLTELQRGSGRPRRHEAEVRSARTASAACKMSSRQGTLSSSGRSSRHDSPHILPCTECLDQGLARDTIYFERLQDQECQLPLPSADVAHEPYLAYVRTRRDSLGSQQGSPLSQRRSSQAGSPLSSRSASPLARRDSLGRSPSISQERRFQMLIHFPISLGAVASRSGAVRCAGLTDCSGLGQRLLCRDVFVQEQPLSRE
jgi:hypothetical protein